jgi:predicted RNase H-like HicB family nuclease
LEGDVVVALLRKKDSTEVAVEIPVLCRIWEEQGVFNGIAEDLPVAVFGKTHEEARSNLKDAIISHLEALRELHKLQPVVEHLRNQARETHLSPRELPRDESLFRFSAAIHDSQILALV